MACVIEICLALVYDQPIYIKCWYATIGKCPVTIAHNLQLPDYRLIIQSAYHNKCCVIAREHMGVVTPFPLKK